MNTENQVKRTRGIRETLNMLSNLRTAISFLTILPVGTGKEPPRESFAEIASYFPLVGWLIGGILATIASMGVDRSVPVPVLAVLIIIVHAFITRGLHLDGFADLLDGLGGATPEKRLAIMKDSSIGVFGAIGLILIIVLKISCIAALIEAHGNNLFLSIAAAPVAARWAMVCLAWKSSYPRSFGTGHSFVGKVSTKQILIGFLFCVPIIVSAGWTGIGILAAAQFPALWLRGKARRALGGVTGDVLGASCELAEAAIWLYLVSVL